MKPIYFLISLLLFIPALSFSQVQNGSIPKDAQVDVTVTDFKNNALPHEIMVFRSKNYNKEYQGLTDDNGKFSIRLPHGDKYDIFILGFKDSTSYDVLDIPAPADKNAYYKKPFTLSFQFMPSKNWELEGCNFETGKATLQPESYAVLDDLVSYMQRKEDDKIEVGGHTDNVGKPAANMVLSQDRANAVRDYLISKGIDASRITAKGYGMTVPVADNKTEAGRAQNRRTEVTILN
ncbi:MAG: OmpA family protein [Bacteroidetes bacterium]|nr:OmpA family protein [Bacteroidota bacterium]